LIIAALCSARDHSRSWAKASCFYHHRQLTRSLEVDHFLASMRYTDDGIENLELADRAYNNCLVSLVTAAAG
jgi:hypothetical protein